jgi:Protein of unknown function (DUF938)
MTSCMLPTCVTSHRGSARKACVVVRLCSCVDALVCNATHQLPGLSDLLLVMAQRLILGDGSAMAYSSCWQGWLSASLTEVVCPAMLLSFVLPHKCPGGGRSCSVWPRFSGSGKVLRQRGLLVVYGPFKRNGVCTTESNTNFDASLRSRDPRWGYRCPSHP